MRVDGIGGLSKCPGCGADLRMVEQNHRCIGMVEIENRRLAELNRALSQQMADLRRLIEPSEPAPTPPKEPKNEM